jgi:hypothetical protein
MDHIERFVPGDLQVLRVLCAAVLTSTRENLAQNLEIEREGNKDRPESERAPFAGSDSIQKDVNAYEALLAWIDTEAAKTN